MTELALTGRSILITGASRGIGAAIATAVVAHGGHAIRIARTPLPPLESSSDFAGDLADPAARASLLAQVTAAHGTPDAVVSNAGAFLLAPLAETTDRQLRQQLAINLEAPFAIARHFLPAMAARGHGIHVLIGSIADYRAFPGNAAYAASKFALRGLHEVLCEEFRGQRVRCTLVSPAATDTAAWDPIDPDHRAGFTPRASMLAPADVAAAVLYALTAPLHVQIESIRLNPR